MSVVSSLAHPWIFCPKRKGFGFRSNRLLSKGWAVERQGCNLHLVTEKKSSSNISGMQEANPTTSPGSELAANYRQVFAEHRTQGGSRCLGEGTGGGNGWQILGFGFWSISACIFCLNDIWMICVFSSDWIITVGGFQKMFSLLLEEDFRIDYSWLVSEGWNAEMNQLVRRCLQRRSGESTKRLIDEICVLSLTAIIKFNLELGNVPKSILKFEGKHRKYLQTKTSLQSLYTPED